MSEEIMAADANLAELARVRNERDLIRDALHQVEESLASERAARTAFEADAAQLRQAALAVVRAVSYAERFKARAELQVLATVAHPGTLIVKELELLRELADDLARWREAGGDIRDLTYVFETMDRYQAMKAGGG